MIWIVFIILSYFVGQYGSKREMGFAWAFFFSFFFSPLIGWCVAADTPKINGRIIVKKPTIWSYIWATICSILAIVLMSAAIKDFSRKHYAGENEMGGLGILCLSIGFIGSALYVARIKSLRYTGEKRRVVEEEVMPETTIAAPVIIIEQQKKVVKKDNPIDYVNLIYLIMAILLAALLVITVIKKGF